MFVPWFVLLLLPFVYFYSEPAAVLALEIFSAFLALLLLPEYRKFPVRLPAYGVGIAVTMMVWLLLLFRSTVESIDLSTSWPALIKVIALLLLFWTTTRISHTPEFSSQLFRAATWAGIFHGLIAIQEFIEAPPIPATWIDPSMKELVRTRCAGIFTDPNVFGAFLGALFIMVTAALLEARTRKEKSLAASSLLLIGLAELTTLSRSSWITLAISFSGMLFFYFREDREKLKCPLLYVMVAILCITALAGPFRHRIFSISRSKDMTIAQRSLINKGIIRNLNSLPLTGTGLHTFNQVYPRFRLVGGDYPMMAHNELIQTMIEAGPLAAAMLLLVFLLIARQTLNPVNTPISRAGALVLLGMFIHNLGGFSSRILPTAATIAAAAAMALGQVNSRSAKLRGLLQKVFAAAIACLAFISAGLGVFSFRINQMMIAAGEESRAGNLQNALELYSLIENADTKNAIASAKKAEIFAVTGNLELARASMARAISCNPTEALLWIKMARLSPNETAEEYYNRAIALDPASELFRLEFARYLLKHGKKQQALDQLDAALAASPGFHEVYRHYQAIEALKAEISEN
ncbi:MAG: O-antigen ligase family protein [Candidatus Rifleibacteriota bacterium]